MVVLRQRAIEERLLAKENFLFLHKHRGNIFLFRRKKSVRKIMCLSYFFLDFITIKSSSSYFKQKSLRAFVAYVQGRQVFTASCILVYRYIGWYITYISYTIKMSKQLIQRKCGKVL